MGVNRLPTATASSSVADILERVLDMGVVVAGDIRIKLVDIELLTIQIRLVICSIDKAREIGMDWWNLTLDKAGPEKAEPEKAEPEKAKLPVSDVSSLAAKLEAMERRMKDLEKV